MANVATLSARAAFDVSAFQDGTRKMLSGLSQIRGAIKETSGQLKGVETSSSSAGDSLGSLSALMGKGAIAGIAFAGAMKGINTITGLVSDTFNQLISGMKWGAELAMQAERAEIAFEVMFNSADRAKQMMKDIESFAIATPFDVASTTENVKMLSAMGVGTEELLPALKTFGDLSLGNADKLQRLALAYGQIMSRGKLTADNFRQIAEAGINMREALAARAGVAVKDLDKTMENGKISAVMFKNALVDVANTKFAGGMDKDLTTMTGQLNKMAELTGSIFKEMASGLGEAFGAKDIVMSMNQMLTDIRDVIKESVSMLREAKVLSGIKNAVGGISLPSYKTYGAMGAGALFGAPAALSGFMTGGSKGAMNALAKVGAVGGAFGGRLDNAVMEGVLPFMQRAKTTNAPAAIKGLQAEATPVNLFEKMASAFVPAITDSINKMQAIGWKGITAFQGGTQSAFGMANKFLQPQPQQPLQTTGALRAGSAEALSAIVRHQMGGDRKNTDEKQLEAMRNAVKHLQKISEAITKEAITLVQIPDLGFGG